MPQTLSSEEGLVLTTLLCGLLCKNEGIGDRFCDGLFDNICEVGILVLLAIDDGFCDGCLDSSRDVGILELKIEGLILDDGRLGESDG